MVKNWRVIGELVAVLSIVITLAFVVYELRLARAQAGAEGLSFGGEMTLQVQSMLAEHPEIWRKGCLGEEMSDTESVVFYRLFNAFTHRNFITWRRTTLGLTGTDPDTFARNIAMHRYMFPGIEAAWKERNSDSEGGWQRAVNEQYSLLVQSDIPKVNPVEYCGQM